MNKMNLQLFAGEKKAISTYGITLKWGKSTGTLTQVVKIKDFPNLGGPPEMLEVTDLNDPMQAFITGVQTSGEMPFTCNYTKTAFEAAQDDAGEVLKYELSFGADGDEGVFGWEGTHSVHVSGTGTNSPVEMVITVAPSTKPELVDDSGF